MFWILKGIMPDRQSVIRASELYYITSTIVQSTIKPFSVNM